jgi:enoyl-CoA hydratase
VLIVTINRPGQRNAINQEVATRLSQAWQRLDDDASLRVAVLTGAGGAFSAGMDLHALRCGEGASAGGRGFAGTVERPPGKPLIAAVEGWALGGGFELALACDLIVASETARFGLPEVTRGVVAAGGGALRLAQRVPHAAAMELVLTGAPIDAARAERLGLVNRLTPPGQALAVAVRLAASIAANAPLAVRASKRVVTESPGWSPEHAFQRQSQIFGPVLASADAREGARAFTEKRPPTWSGA